MQSTVPSAALPVTWPMDFATTQSKEDAFADLAGLWGLSYPADASRLLYLRQ